MVDKFIQTVLSHIANPFVLGTISRELSNHLEDSINTYVERGYNQNDAEDKAIEAMGDPAELGQSLNYTHPLYIDLFSVLSKITVAVAVWVVIFMIVIPNVSKINDKYQGKKDLNEVLSQEIYPKYPYSKKLELEFDVINTTYKVKEFRFNEENEGLLILSEKTRMIPSPFNQYLFNMECENVNCQYQSIYNGLIVYMDEVDDFVLIFDNGFSKWRFNIELKDFL